MKRIKRLIEYTNYTDETSKNIPNELLDINHESDKIEFNKFISSLDTKLSKVILKIMKLYIDGDGEYIDDIFNSFDDDYRKKVESTLSEIGNVFYKTFKDKVNQN